MGLIDLRYPFQNIEEFYQSFFFRDAHALHLSLAHILIFAYLFFSVIVNRKRLLFFVSTYAIFGSLISNPSFKAGTLNVFDWATLISSFLLVYQTLVTEKVKWTRIEIWFLGFLMVLFFHSILAFTWYNFDKVADFSERIILASRPISTFFVIKLFKAGLKEDKGFLPSFKRDLALILSISAITYLAQVCLLKAGLITYGTMPSAGFGGQRFGGISIEGGHLSKFSFPLLIGLYVLNSKRSELIFTGLMTVVFLLNVSASGYVSYIVFLTATIWFFIISNWKKLLSRAKMLWICISALAASIVFFSMFQSQLSGLFSKVAGAIELMGSPEADIYGRSPLISVYSLSSYPLGLGYGGSTHRNIVANVLGIYENNLGLNILLSNLSLIAIPLLFFFLFMFRTSLFAIQRSSLKTAINFGCIASITAAFVLDSLWAIPAYYLSIVLISNNELAQRFPYPKCNEEHQDNSSAEWNIAYQHSDADAI